MQQEPRWSGQKQQIKAWQEFLKIISRNETRDLNLLMQKYRLFPDWLVCYDEKKLQAWLPEAAGFYLLRNLELHRLEPVPPRVQPDMAGISSAEPRVYYQVLLRSIRPVFYSAPGSAEFVFFPGGNGSVAWSSATTGQSRRIDSSGTLAGLQPDFTWLGIQINLLQAESQPDTDARGVRTFARLFGRSVWWSVPGPLRGRTGQSFNQSGVAIRSGQGHKYGRPGRDDSLGK
jgi:hypothetical protein